MKHFISIKDVLNPMKLIQQSMDVKQNPHQHSELGKHKTLGLVFFNSSLRTRMSMTRAAYNLGLNVMALNVNSDSWQLEFADGAVMDQGSAEHIREAVPVLSSYCDIIGVRSFPGLVDREEDYQEKIINSFVQLGSCPIVNLESATLHPLQSLTDMMTITETKEVKQPKVVMTWAPHIKPLPQAVANSFLQWASQVDVELTVTHPEGLELADEFTAETKVEYDQDRALKDADFIYVKNWSSYRNYGRVAENPEWQLTLQKLAKTNEAKVMHCLPVRRNLVISDEVLNSDHSLVIQQAENRLYTAQAVLMNILNDLQ